MSHPRFIHYSPSPLDLDREQRYRHNAFHKPSGLWLSTDERHDWAAHCRESEYLTDCLASRAEIRLRPDARLLTIGSKADLREFVEEYTLPRLNETNWKLVAYRFDGLLCHPYNKFWTMGMAHLGTRWYWGLDIPSACIWNMDVIESVKVLTEAVASDSIGV